MIERSEILYGKITCSTQSVNVTSEEIESGSRDGHLMPYLIVFIAHETQAARVSLVWDFRTGELIQVCNEVRVSGKENIKENVSVMRKGEAADTTASWLSILGIASKAPRRKLAAAPENSSNGSYMVRWRGADQEATITIQDQTGELIKAHIRRLD